MVSGTFVLTDSIDKAFNSIFTDSRKGSDAVITGKAATSTNNGSTAPTIPQSLLARVQALPDVLTAEGNVASDSAHLIDKNGKAIVFGAHRTSASASRTEPRASIRSTLVDGAWPRGKQVVIDKGTANKKHLAVGDTIGVQAQGPIVRLQISGIVKFGTVGSIGGATLAGFDLPTAHHSSTSRARSTRSTSPRSRTSATSSC